MKFSEKINKMTLHEKALQLTQVNANMIVKDDAAVWGFDYMKLPEDDMQYVGSVLSFSGARKAIEAQKKHLTESNEPLIFMQDVIHGYRTLYPIPLAIGCSFDLQLAEDCAKMAGIEAKENGVHITFSPMVDLVRDARWGRVMESTGEDPYLNGEMAKAFIRGYHDAGIGVCVKHFAAYGNAEAGKDYNTTDMSEHTFYEYYLRGYEECMKEKPEMLMTSFNLLNGIPVSAHKDLLIDLVRNKWHFDGVVISDYNALREMVSHGYASTLKDCARIAANNEIDIEMMSPCYAKHLEELVNEGTVSESTVDNMLERIFELKDKFGLYDNPTKNIVEDAFEAPLREEHRNIARRAAEESSVLLKNNGILPLSKDAKIALIGPYADWGWTYGGWNCFGNEKESVTLKQGFENFTGRVIPTSYGCSPKLLDNNESTFDEAIAVAKECDVIIACLGEHPWDSAESSSRAHLKVAPLQRKLLGKLAELGKKLVLVEFAGRPQALTDIEQLCDAILYVWHPGTEAGNAIANLVYGAVNPSAKLTMSFPRSVGQCPIYYNSFSTGRAKPKDDVINGYGCVSKYKDEFVSPLYPFGYGLSYTTFELTDIDISSSEMHFGDKVVVSATLINTGDRDGTEVVQMYIHDKFGSYARPIKELKGFKRITLAKGESKIVSFEITEETLKYYMPDGTYQAEKGEFEIMIGLRSDELLKVNLELK